jgi:hypothetical protein
LRRQTAARRGAIDQCDHPHRQQSAITGILGTRRVSDDPFPVSQELHDKGIERLQELAFQGNAPLDIWVNTITYLAEMSGPSRLRSACVVGRQPISWKLYAFMEL